MKFRVSDGYSAAVEFEAATPTQFLDRCAGAINQFWLAKIPAYQTRKLNDAIKFHALELHTKTALDKSTGWSWVARDGCFVRVTIGALFKNYSAVWEIAECTQRHGRALSEFLGAAGDWVSSEVSTSGPKLTLVSRRVKR